MLRAFVCKLAVLAGLTGIVFAVPGWAAIPQRDIFRIDNSKPLEVVKRVDSVRVTTDRDIQFFIPMDLKPTDNEQTVATQIVYHSLNSLLKTRMVRTSAVGKLVGSIGGPVEEEMNMGKSKINNYGKVSEVDHKVKLKLEALKTEAAVKYSGFVNAKLSYTVLNKAVDFEISEQLDKNTQLVLNHHDAHGEKTESLSLRWNW